METFRIFIKIATYNKMDSFLTSINEDFILKEVCKLNSCKGNGSDRLDPLKMHLLFWQSQSLILSIFRSKPVLYHVLWKMQELFPCLRRIRDLMSVTIRLLVFFLLFLKFWKKLCMFTWRVIWWKTTYYMNLSLVFGVDFSQKLVWLIWQNSLVIRLRKACIQVWFCWIFRRPLIQSTILFSLTNFERWVCVL